MQPETPELDLVDLGYDAARSEAILDKLVGKSSAFTCQEIEDLGMAVSAVVMSLGKRSMSEVYMVLLFRLIIAIGSGNVDTVG